MLKTKEVEITLHTSNISHYESLGYEIPRVKVKNKYVVRKGTKITVKAEDLLPGTNVMVEYICDYCGEIKPIMYCDYTRKTSNKDCCIDCLGKYKSELNKKQWEEKFDSELKICSKCKRELPKDLEHFQKNISRPDGLSCQCKECIHNKKIFGIEKIIKLKKSKQVKNYFIKINKDYYIAKDGFKICKGCERKLPSTSDYFYRKHDTKDGLQTKCKECNNSVFTDKLTRIPQDGYKFCIKCNRELLIDIKYFPPDKMCKDGLRNVCRECGKDQHFMEDGYIPINKWNKEENEIFINRYNKFTNTELMENFYPNETLKSLHDRAWRLGVTGKTPEVLERTNKEKSEKMSGGNSPLFGVPKSEETRRRISLAHKGKISPLRGIKWDKNDNRRKLISLRTKGKWSGSKNPRSSNPLIGKNNPNWRGGITALYFELRSEIKDWQKQSMEFCNYKCILTGKEFDNIHHLYPFRKIVDEVFEILQLNLHSQVKDYSEDEFKLILDKLHELHNKYGLGVCLSKEIHKLFHDTYGYTNNTLEQFEEFVNRYYNFEFDNLLEEKYKYCKALKEVDNNKNQLLFV